MNEDITEMLKNYVTREELHQILSAQRTASEQFLEDHDRNFRTLEQQVAAAVSNLNAGLSKLSIMSDALSNIMRLQSDNYEAIRTTQRNHEERISTTERVQGVQREEYNNLYGALFGDSDHPDKESVMAVLKRRSMKADQQFDHIMERFANMSDQFSNLENRQRIIEAKVSGWQKIISTSFNVIATGIKTAVSSLAGRVLILAITVFLSARVTDPQLLDQIGIIISKIITGK